MKAKEIISNDEDKGDLAFNPRCVHSSASLRQELSLRALRMAKREGLLHEATTGAVPSVLFGRDEAGRHGNFHADSYARIKGIPELDRRLSKAHTAYKRVRARADWEWKELDSANSSDALLMNIFCHPETFANGKVTAMLGVEADATPVFGHKARVPLKRGVDRTEVDMKIGSLFIEAKLTETDFQQARSALVERYRDFEEVFDCGELPFAGNVYGGYQLIRGTLAAHAAGGSFCVLCDGRRQDLIEAWFRIMRAVTVCELRSRLKLLTWQELASALPPALCSFLESKYGIVANP